MNRKGVIAIAVLAAIVIGVALYMLQPRSQFPEDNGTIIANGTEPVPKEVVNVMSARSAFPFVQRWASQYNNIESATGTIEIDYYLDEPSVPSDLVVVGDTTYANGSHVVPASAQAVAIVYNIPGLPDIPSGMKLNSSVLSSIFNGTITLWNDSAVKDLNPDLNLPAERILVVHESRNSSSLALLERYLSMNISWPEDSTNVMGPDELAATVRQTPYSIGYVDFSYATQTRMTYAAIDAGGRYLLPSMQSIGQTVNGSMQIQNASSINQAYGLTPPFINASMLGNSSYPITSLYYASFSGDVSNATLDFVKWITDQDRGQQTLSEVQYPAIYRDNEMLSTYRDALINSTASKAADN